MCGVFGFVAKGNHDPDLTQLKRIAKTTMQRGSHAFGFAWIDSRGRLKMFKQSGRITDSIGMLNLAKDARMLIGHCRYATRGSPSNNLNNHPHPADGGWIVHNGVIDDYDHLVRRYGIFPISSCDSEVIGHLIERAQGTLTERMRATVFTIRRAPLVAMGLWNRPRRLITVRQGNPLHIGYERNGTYLGSLSDDLPGDVEAVADDTILEFSNQGLKRIRLYT